MTAASARSEIQRFTSMLLRESLALAIGGAVIRRRYSNTLVTWSGSETVEPFGLANDFGSLGEYRRLLTSSSFSALLFDGSILQLSLEFDGAAICKHRYLYFPCPIVVDFREYVDEPNFDIREKFDELLLDAVLEIGQGNSQTPHFRLRSPLRFDFDIEAQDVGHPASHLHLSQESVRLPVFGPLCLGNFARLIFMHFYPEIWQAHPEVRAWPITSSSRSLTPEEEAEIFVEFRRTLDAGPV